MISSGSDRPFPLKHIRAMSWTDQQDPSSGVLQPGYHDSMISIAYVVQQCAHHRRLDFLFRNPTVQLRRVRPETSKSDNHSNKASSKTDNSIKASSKASKDKTLNSRANKAKTLNKGNSKINKVNNRTASSKASKDKTLNSRANKAKTLNKGNSKINKVNNRTASSKDSKDKTLNSRAYKAKTLNKGNSKINKVNNRTASSKASKMANHRANRINKGNRANKAGDGDRNGQNQDNNGDRNGNGNDQNQNDDGNRNGEDNNGNRNGDQDGDRNGQNNGDNNDRGGNSQQQNSQGSDRQNGDSGTSGINGGAKTGIIVGGSVGAVAILAILVYILWRKRRGASFADIVRFRKPSEDVVVEKGNNNGAVLPIYRQDRFSVRTDQPDMLKSVPDAPFAAASARSDRGSVVEPTLWKSANPPMPSPVEEQKIESVEETKDSSAWPLGDRSPTLVNDSPTSDAVHHTLPSRDRAQPPRFELRRSGSSLGLAPPAHNPVYSTSDNNDRIRTADTVATSSAPKAKRWSRTNVSRNSSVNSRKNPASLAKARNLTNWATRQDKGARQHQQHSQGTIHTATSTTVTKAPPLKNHAVKPILAPPPSAAKRAAAQKKSSPSRPNIERHHRVGSLSMIFKPVSSDSSKDGSPKSPKSPVEPPPALNMTGDAVRLREMDAGDARRRSSVRQSYTRGFGSYGGPQHGGGDGAGRNGLLPSTGYDSRYHHQRGGGSTVSGSTVTGDDFPPPPAEHAVSPLMEDELRGGTWS
ncbi:hypothetical protein BST61_g126 [Cercospora zeina]